MINITPDGIFECYGEVFFLCICVGQNIIFNKIEIFFLQYDV